MDDCILRSAFIPKSPDAKARTEQIIFSAQPIFLPFNGSIIPVKANPVFFSIRSGNIIPLGNVLSSAKAEEIIGFKKVLEKEYQLSQNIMVIVVIGILEIYRLGRGSDKIEVELPQFDSNIRLICDFTIILKSGPEIIATP